MIVSIIVAMSDDNRGIGLENKIPWRLASDMKRFRELTTGHHIIMGRKTFESIGKPLPKRTNIVLTRNPDWNGGECYKLQSLASALNFAENRGEEEVFICGGTDVYNEALKLAHKLYITYVHGNGHIIADTHFPYFYCERGWTEIHEEFIPADLDKNQFPSTFKIYVRKSV